MKVQKSKARYNEVRNSMAQHQARITSKGQVTIPRSVRQMLGVKAGDTIVFENDGLEMKVRRVHKVSPFAKYRGIGNPGMPFGKERIIAYVRELRDS
jgi:antitoxin PrlF